MELAICAICRGANIQAHWEVVLESKGKYLIYLFLCYIYACHVEGINERAFWQFAQRDPILHYIYFKTVIYISDAISYTQYANLRMRRLSYGTLPVEEEKRLSDEFEVEEEKKLAKLYEKEKKLADESENLELTYKFVCDAVEKNTIEIDKLAREFGKQQWMKNLTTFIREAKIQALKDERDKLVADTPKVRR